MSLIATVGPTGGVKNRLNIVDFVEDKKFFTLYVRALGKLIILSRVQRLIFAILCAYRTYTSERTTEL